MPSTALRDLNWRLITTAILVVTVSTLPTFITAAAIAQAGPELGYGTQRLGLLTALFFLTASGSSSVIGRVVERWGWRRTMQINATASALVLLTVALAIRTVTGLTVMLIVAAVFYGAANPAANLALAEDVPRSRRGLVFGLKHAGIPTSTLLAGVAVPLVVLTLGWRWAYGLASLLAVGVFFLIPRERDRERDHVSSGPAPKPAAASPTPSGPVPRMAVRWLALLSLASAFATVAATALSTFQVDAAIELGFTEGAAGKLLAIASLCSIAARAAYGFAADRTGTNGLAWIATLAAIGAGTFIVMGFVSGPAFAAATIVAFMTGWAWPGLLTYSVVRANEGRAAGSTATTQAGIFIGAGLGPFGAGWLAENVSFQAAWLAVATSLGIAAVLMLVVRAGGMGADLPGPFAPAG